jgi:hypothetical protein
MAALGADDGLRLLALWVRTREPHAFRTLDATRLADMHAGKRAASRSLRTRGGGEDCDNNVSTCMPDARHLDWLYA